MAIASYPGTVSSIVLAFKLSLAAHGLLVSGILWNVCMHRVHLLILTRIDLRKAASQREIELMDSADQCRAVLEDQVSSLRKQVASLEHDLCSTKEDLREGQQQLRRKV